ncbi:hypothetical protein [Neisseria sp. HMSC075C12]|uniref:hypothetical protein n=1 Tax=Neisseria sp. HMSC075C12 TaxID=1739282 RepID=UPI0008A66255|nr:hypothetical protein [Neisseria sp. HMSC075C12]OFL27857.1 hypothetical protein HMPREF2778_07300 [Neisseria sp. HMSC075C12]
MTIKQTGGTIVGAVVQNLPVVIDGRMSIYEEGIKNGTLPKGMTFQQFLDMLSVGVTDADVDKKVEAAVSAHLIKLGLLNQNGQPVNQNGNAQPAPSNNAQPPAPVQPSPAPVQPAPAPVQPAPAQPAPQPSDNNSGAGDVSDETLAKLDEIL